MRSHSDTSPIDPQVERELEALEAALADQPVDPDLADLADLATELRELRPVPTQEFATDLDERAALGFGPRRRSRPLADRAAAFAAGIAARLRGIPPRRALATAGAGALAAVAVATAIVSVGDRGADGTSRPDAGTTTEAVGVPPAGEATAQPPAGSAALGSTASTAGPKELDRTSTEATGPFAARAGRRAVERSAQLVLGTEPEGVRPAADRVFATVGRYDGIVLTSSIRDGGAGDAGADFTLLIPSDRLSAALADLSVIAEVRSRQEDARDITAPTVTVAERLRDARAEVQGLLKQLAKADTDTERASVKAQLRFQHERVAALRASLNDLRRRANLSRVSLQVLTGDASAFSVSGDDQWSIGDALRDARRILAVATGVILVGLAILAPIALIAALAWVARRAWIRAGRERALEG